MLAEETDALYSEVIGTTGGTSINIRMNGMPVIDSTIGELRTSYTSALESQLNNEVHA